MAEKVGIMPVRQRPRLLSDVDAARLKRRREALDALRKQTRAAENRLRWDIFNTWRTGSGTMAAIAEATNYRQDWVWRLINRIRNNDKFLQMAIDEYLKENPDATI
jgi:t-SNARE complex subunit (syntaxin)